MADSTLARWSPVAVRWHYEDGFLLLALQRIGEEIARPEYLRFVRESAEHLVAPDGVIRTYRLDEYNLDQVNPGKVLFHFLGDGNDGRYRSALTVLRDQLRGQPRCRSGGFWHKKIYPHQMWLDGSYMAAPFYASYSSLFAEVEAFGDVTHQLLLMEEKTRDPATGLLHHAWDESRRQLWANPENGCSPCFWARAMGWFAMALVDVLDVLPLTHGDRGPVLAALRRLLGALLRFQDPDTGLWFQVIDQAGREGNFPEASACCMFVYAMLRAFRHRYVAEPSFDQAARRAFDAVVERFVTEDRAGSLSLDGTCASAGLGGNPYRDGSFAYYVGERLERNDPKGVAAFLLASREIEHETDLQR